MNFKFTTNLGYLQKVQSSLVSDNSAPITAGLRGRELYARKVILSG